MTDNRVSWLSIHKGQPRNGKSAAYALRRFSIVIPCLNEEQAIDQVIRRIYDVLPELRRAGVCETEIIIVVDDASTDASWEVLNAWPKVIALRNHKRPANYGGSLKRGFAVASRRYYWFFGHGCHLRPTRIRADDPNYGSARRRYGLR